MKIYLVGGAVRDRLLGLEVKDRDYVVVGGSAQRLLDYGYKQVGADFPVFLHPETGEEYALARVERKSGNGYHGFTVETDGVTLEDDLARRDLTINSMAMDLDTGAIIDPFGGQADLERGILRHTSAAFTEDPVRVLRIARFAARYNFVINHETVELCKQLVATGELDHLVQERVWLEVEKALAEKEPGAFFNVLHAMGAFEVPALSMFSEYDLAAAEVNELAKRVPPKWHTEIMIAIIVKASGGRLERRHLHGLSSTVPKVLEMLKSVWVPEAAFMMLGTFGAFREGWPLVRDVLTSMLTEREVRGFERARSAALSVTAAQFPALEGKELGQAINEARANAVKEAYERAV